MVSPRFQRTRTKLIFRCAAHRKKAKIEKLARRGKVRHVFPYPPSRIQRLAAAEMSKLLHFITRLSEDDAAAARAAAAAAALRRCMPSRHVTLHTLPTFQAVLHVKYCIAVLCFKVRLVGCSKCGSVVQLGPCCVGTSKEGPGKAEQTEMSKQSR